MQTGANWAGSFVVYGKTPGVWGVLGPVLLGMEKPTRRLCPGGRSRPGRILRDEEWGKPQVTARPPLLS